MEWTTEEEEMKNAALLLVKKRELAWEDDLAARIAGLIEEIEADNETIERSIQSVTSLQVDEVQQSKRTLHNMEPQAAALDGKFGEVEALMSQERGNIKDFKQLKQINLVLERTTSVINTADTLVSLQRRFVDLTAPTAPLFSVCEEILPVHQFQQDLSSSTDPQNREAIATFTASHFQLLGSVATTVVDRLRQVFTNFAARGNEIHSLDLPRDADVETRIYNELLDAVRTVSHEGAARMLTQDPSVYNRSEIPFVQSGSMWDVAMHWVDLGADRLWHSLRGCTEGSVASSCAPPNTWHDMPKHLNAWINSIDRVIFYMLKDAHDVPEDAVFQEGLWESRDRALDVAQVLIDNAHDKVQGVVTSCLDVLGKGGTQAIGPPDILSIRWWLADYEARIASCFSGMGMELRPAAKQPRPSREEGRKDVINRAGMLLRHASQALKCWLADKAEAMALVLVKDCLFAEPGQLRMHNDYRLITPGPIDFLELLETQLAEISRFNDAYALESLAVGVQLASVSFCAVLRRSVTLDAIPTFEGRPEEDVEYPLRLLCALANDMTRCEDEVLRIERAIKERIPAQQHCNVNSDGAVAAFRETRAAMIEGARACVNATCKDSWNGVFGTYDESERRAADNTLVQFQDVLKTLQDYASDLMDWLHAACWRDLARALAVGVEQRYLQAFVHFVDKRKGVLSSGKVLFADYAKFRQVAGDREWGAEPSRAVGILSGMLDAGTTDKFREYVRQLFEHFPDTPAGFGRIFIPKIGAFTEKERKALLEDWNDHAASREPPSHPVTVMGRLEIPEATGLMAKLRGSKKPPAAASPRVNPGSTLPPPAPLDASPPPPAPRPEDRDDNEIKCQSLADFLN
eukprot:TRINITY_DN4153_c3_g3_i1.p1 TRINITY_DN4153_c3_g3~~TRINITY_DN4153_c3_g3_i1.p1  ORF type:complete len:861 (+),score=276.95 TRINITY_DN4153_c3_g3_i1:170-2752(+)